MPCLSGEHICRGASVTDSLWHVPAVRPGVRAGGFPRRTLLGGSVDIEVEVCSQANTAGLIAPMN